MNRLQLGILPLLFYCSQCALHLLAVRLASLMMLCNSRMTTTRRWQNCREL